MNINPYAVVLNDRDRDGYPREKSIMVCDSEEIAQAWAEWANKNIISSYDAQKGVHYSTEPTFLVSIEPNDDTTPDGWRFLSLPC